MYGVVWLQPALKVDILLKTQAKAVLLHFKYSESVVIKVESKVGINELELDDLCKALLNADPDIQDIILFGSYVYAPSLARDIDLLVTTAKRKPIEIYCNLIADFSKYVDLIIRETCEEIGNLIAWGIRATGCVLYGKGDSLKSILNIPMITFRQVQESLYQADDIFLSAESETDADIKDEAYRDSFDKLFDVARLAAMSYSDRGEDLFKSSCRSLSEVFKERFNEIINKLHIVYSDNGDYPKDNVVEEFGRWRNTIEQFIKDLEQDS
ncbi:MAG: hypothetical protein QG588_1248 [Candidatus Poribacteria bacterium]|nr:hypothetical protein [Candidatus Poribacteria bacterium]